ncbi:MAG: cytochrome P450 [Polyangiaceae bacterium]
MTSKTTATLPDGRLAALAAIFTSRRVRRMSPSCAPGAEARSVDELRRAFNAFLQSLIEERREELANGAEPGNDVISMLIAAREAERMTNMELVAFCVLLTVAGFETTVNAVANGWLALMTHPEELRKLRADPSLVESMIEEAVRWDGPVLTFFRNTLSDITLHDVTIPARSKVMIAFASGNRDERKFPDPDAFRVDRDASDHLGYGAGVHFCLGAPLARMQLAAMAKGLLRHTSSIEQDGEVERTASILFRGVKKLPVHLKPAAGAARIARSSHADWLDAPAPAAPFAAHPLRIAVGDDVLADLKERLARTRWPDLFGHAGWDSGANLGFMKELVA